MIPFEENVHGVSAVAKAADPLMFPDPDYGRLLQDIGDARIVLIGEASHGTHDFYRERARITRHLIEQKGFRAVAVEADWPDAYRLNLYCRGESQDSNGQEALSGFRRFPAWMWRNVDVLDFAEWLRQFNGNRKDRVGFYGLDLYSLYTSAQEVIRYLNGVDPEAAQRARYRYSCFEDFGEDSQAYGYAASFELEASCEAAVVRQLEEMRQRAFELAPFASGTERDEAFSAGQNAMLVHDAEQYYRTMFTGRVNSWNLRDRHMNDALCYLLEHLGRDAKVVVWAHNSHLGDARATDMGRMGELNLGQLVRERYAGESFLLGFTTYSGEVTAATDWDGPAERKVVRHGLNGSVEALMHETGLGDFYLSLRDPEVRDALQHPMLERAIGVIYRPETERVSHYFHVNLPQQFDALIHIDRTKAVIPLEKAVPVAGTAEAPETYPSGV